MKVLQAAKMEWSDTFTCAKCQSVLQVEASDVKYKYVRCESIWGRGEDWYMDFYYADCPICKSAVSTAMVPSHIKTLIKNGT